tara:strand:+ start:10605 stop:10850 length:246 start_codon:yes stop_codon:yes gene_type:complete
MRGECDPFFREDVMSDQNAQPDNQPRLYPEDQAKVDEFVTRGVNSVERKPFKPIRLLVLLMVVVLGFSLMSQLIAKWAGIY